MRIDELDEFQGLTPDMVRQWLSATGQPERACPNYQVCVHLGTHTHHGIAPMDFSVAEDWSGHWQRVNLLSVALWYIAAKQAKSMQALLREINPRMRKGMPSEAARKAYPSWLVRDVETGEVELHRTECASLYSASDYASKSLRIDAVPLRDFGEFMEFWPCDANGNKVRWPTDAEGNML